MAEVVAREVLCVRCGYNLRTMKTEGVCPECGLAVQTTLRVEKGRTPAASGAWWLALGAVLMMIVGGLETLLGVYHDVVVLVVRRYVSSWWYTPYQPAAVLVSVALFGAIGVVARSGLGPEFLKWGGVHAPLYWVCRGVCFLMAAPYAALYFFANLNGLAGFHSLAIYRACNVMLLLAMALNFVPMTYAYLYMRGVGARPEFMRIRSFSLGLFAGFITLHAASTGLFAYYISLLLQTPMGATAQAAVTLNWIITFAHQALNVVELGYWLFVLRLARSVLRAAQA